MNEIIKLVHLVLLYFFGPSRLADNPHHPKQSCYKWPPSILGLLQKPTGRNPIENARLERKLDKGKNKKIEE